MLNELINTEIQYTKKFSQSIEGEYIIRFWDNNLPAMYTHNFTFLKNSISLNKLQNVILNELKLAREKRKKFLRIEANFAIDNNTISGLPINPEVSRYDFMFIKSSKYGFLSGNPNCIIKEAVTPQILCDGIEVDILANKGAMGMEFATRRIERKADIYKAPNSNISLYVCYNNDIPIGNCELMIQSNIAKIEDFDIIEKYQRRGFGTSVLKHLLKKANNCGAQISYLITDSDDTAKEMYEKNGFNKIGEKTELFFNI